MLIEELEVNGIHVVSSNTDGILCLFDRSKLDKYYEICHAWERRVQMPTVEGQLLGALEFTEYKKMVQKSVNDYIAVPLEGKLKRKGDFLVDYELNKNPSRRILPIIYERYFIGGISPEDTIEHHNRLSDFCIGLKSSRDYHYERINPSTMAKTIYHRVVRYYVSSRGELLVKVKNEGSEATGPQISNCEARAQGHWWTTECNSYGSGELSGVDKRYYLESAYEFINSIQKSQKRGKKVIFNKQQQSMF